MAIFSVTYDLMRPGQDYSRLQARIDDYDSHKAQYSQWLINAAMSAAALRDDLGQYTDKNDRLAVMAIVPKGWATRNMRSTAEWLEARGY